MSSVIVLDSSDDESEIASEPSTNTHISTKNMLKQDSSKRKFGNDTDKPRKRIKPLLVSKTVDPRNFEKKSPVIVSENAMDTNVESNAVHARVATEDYVENKGPGDNMHEEQYGLEEKRGDCSEHGCSPEKENINSSEIYSDLNPVTPPFQALLEACKRADTSEDMSTLIEKKLMKYYHEVHPDFVTSKGFVKTVKSVHAQIETNPELVYYQLKSIVEELKIRRKTKTTVMSNEEVASTGNERRDHQIRLLSRGLLKVTKRIEKLEESDVDLRDEDNSTYLQTERLMRHACKIYDKICDLTGESKHAKRTVKKPVFFEGTSYPQFNKTLQAFVNRTNTFPDYFDVLRCLEHCNAQYGFELRNDEMKKIAQDAFVKIGKLLQNRRKVDLYETVSHFTGTTPDPALEDDSLNAKLLDNQKFHAKIGSIIDRYAKEQEHAVTEQKTRYNNQSTDERENKDSEITSGNETLPPTPCKSNSDQDNIQHSVEKGICSIKQETSIEEIIISDEDDS